MGLESMRVLDLSQDFSMHTPAFASYDGPSIKWVKRLAFDKVGGQEAAGEDEQIVIRATREQWLAVCDGDMTIVQAALAGDD